MRSPQPTVVDFFCGAGGFSEGFRQQGFKVIMGIENWRPAIESHNLNHHLSDTVKDVLDFESLEEIEKLPNTDIIIGSPPCQLFSMSNNAGKSDKTLGMRLIETYLGVIAVKKHQKNSLLKAWFLENVPNSRKYIKSHYTFEDLRLGQWALENGKKPGDIALEISTNSAVLNAADYGAPQKRQRFVCGEIIPLGRFIEPKKTRAEYVRLCDIKSRMPQPNSPRSRKVWTDPNYPSLSLPADQISDHFYDTGIFETYWRNARDYKLNHAYMGKMSFPEDENSPSRTVMATRSSSSRESLIYKSEYGRKGDGEYRTPTIREISSLMGFPLVYQFVGGQSTKWAQIGNAVPPHLSAALAKTVREALGMRPVPISSLNFDKLKENYLKVENLNDYSEKKFDKPPTRKALSRFRKHPFKEGNMTVALTNYHPTNHSSGGSKLSWHSSVFYGTGKGFAVEVLKPGMYRHFHDMIMAHDKVLGKRFVDEFNKHFSHVLKNVKHLQDAHESPHKFDNMLNPDILVDKIAEFISGQNGALSEKVHTAKPIAGRSILPVRQLYAMYAINKLISSQ